MKSRLLLVTVILSSFCSIPASAQTRGYARVISENANLRAEPSVASDSQQEIPEGTLVKVLDQKLPWYIVRVRDNVGWVHGNTIEFISSEDLITTQRRKTPGTTVGSQSTEQTITERSDKPTKPRRPVYRETDSAPRAVYDGRIRGDSRIYITGPRGGCYYISGSGRKVYVDRSVCN